MDPHVRFKSTLPWKWMLTNFTKKLTLRTGLRWNFDIFLLTTRCRKRLQIWRWIMNIKVLMVVLIQINLISISYTTYAFRLDCVLRGHQGFCIQLMQIRTESWLVLRTGDRYLLSWKNTRMRHSAWWNILYSGRLRGAGTQHDEISHTVEDSEGQASGQWNLPKWSKNPESALAPSGFL